MNFLSSFCQFVMEKGRTFFTFQLYLKIAMCRFSYIVYMLEHLLDFTQHYKKVHVLYDVACSLSKHLEVRFKIISWFHFYNKQNQGRHDLNQFF